MYWSIYPANLTQRKTCLSSCIKKDMICSINSFPVVSARRQNVSDAKPRVSFLLHARGSGQCLLAVLALRCTTRATDSARSLDDYRSSPAMQAVVKHARKPQTRALSTSLDSSCVRCTTKKVCSECGLVCTCTYVQHMALAGSSRAHLGYRRQRECVLLASAGDVCAYTVITKYLEPPTRPSNKIQQLLCVLVTCYRV
jgi:hypothetical protein